jgi:hypothetical protein
MTIRAQIGPIAAERVNDHRPLHPLDSPSLSPHRLAVLAHALLLIDDAHLYGLIDSGPDVDRGRCRQVIDDLARQGIGAASEEIEAAALALMAELGAVRP